MRTLGILACVIMAFAGCAEPEAEDSSRTDTNSSLPATTTLTTTPTTPTAPASPEPQHFLVDFTGHVAASACVPAGLDSCSGARGPDDDSFTTLSAPTPSMWHGNLTLTWDASTEAMRTLRLYVLPYRTCGEGCVESVGPGIEAEGTSPLVLGVQLNASGDAQGLWIGADSVKQVAQPPVYGGAATPQDFRLAGDLWATTV